MATQPHFLIVSLSAQGHINPTRQLARRLARFCGARITIAIPTQAYHRMFSSSPDDNNNEHDDDDDKVKGLVTYTAFSDGTEEGLNPPTDMPKVADRVVESLTSIGGVLAARGEPITCLVYALIMPMAAQAARNLGVPSVLFWIQPASVFAIYHHYFNSGYAEIIVDHKNEASFSVELPGLVPLQIQDLPSFLTDPNPDDPYYFFFTLFEQLFQLVATAISSGSKPTVLVNTFSELEASVLSSIDDVDLLPVGPLVSPSSGQDLFEHDTSDYMEWLDSKGDKSVVYVSFGSLAVLSREQMEEVLRGLEESERPYIWVVRRDSKEKEAAGLHDRYDDRDKGLIVEWCNQVNVLSHRSIGCFVTHCGWNSTTESVVCGVPTVMLPQWTDQSTNARLMEGMWGMGLRAKASEEGLVEAKELQRCLDVVMGEGDIGVEIRRRTEMWREKAQEAAMEGGSSVRNMRAFVERFGVLSSTKS